MEVTPSARCRQVCAIVDKSTPNEEHTHAWHVAMQFTAVHAQLSIIFVFPALFSEQLLRPLEVRLAIRFPRATIAGELF